MKKINILLNILMVVAICISLGAVSANDDSANMENLTVISDCDANSNLNAIKDCYSDDNLSHINDSDFSLNKTDNNILGVNQNDSSETLSSEVNASADVLSSSVDVYGGHTYNKKGYTFTVSASQYKKIQYVKNHKYDEPDEMDGHKVGLKIKTNKYYKVKKPIYTTKKVIKYKWKYKYVLTGKSYYKNGKYHYKSYYAVSSYYKKGWKYHAYASDSNNQGGYNDYAVVKKKVKYTATKKVKTKKYKIVKKPVYASIETHRIGDFDSDLYYAVTYDFYVFGAGYIKFGGVL